MPAIRCTCGNINNCIWNAREARKEQWNMSEGREVWRMVRREGGVNSVHLRENFDPLGAREQVELQVQDQAERQLHFNHVSSVP